jgi:hypothetical protein
MNNQRTTNRQPIDTNNKVNKVNPVNKEKKINKFFNKNFSSQVNLLFDDYIKQEIRFMNRPFNYSRLRNLIEELKVIATTDEERKEVVKKAIATGCHTFEALTGREKASIGNDQWDWSQEYLKP